MNPSEQRERAIRNVTLMLDGAVITLLGICGLTHKQSYVDIFICAVAIPVMATITLIVLGSMEPYRCNAGLTHN